jgi:hypothetical protein
MTRRPAMTDLTDDKRVLIKMASFVTQSKKPTTYVELCKLLWEAFQLGKAYRDAGGKE